MTDMAADTARTAKHYTYQGPENMIAITTTHWRKMNLIKHGDAHDESHNTHS